MIARRDLIKMSRVLVVDGDDIKPIDLVQHEVSHDGGITDVSIDKVSLSIGFAGDNLDED